MKAQALHVLIENTKQYTHTSYRQINECASYILGNIEAAIEDESQANMLCRKINAKLSDLFFRLDYERFSNLLHEIVIALAEIHPRNNKCHSSQRLLDPITHDYIDLLDESSRFISTDRYIWDFTALIQHLNTKGSAPSNPMTNQPFTVFDNRALAKMAKDAGMTLRFQKELENSGRLFTKKEPSKLPPAILNDDKKLSP